MLLALSFQTHASEGFEDVVTYHVNFRTHFGLDHARFQLFTSRVLYEAVSGMWTKFRKFVTQLFASKDCPRFTWNKTRSLAEVGTPVMSPCLHVLFTPRLPIAQSLVLHSRAIVKSSGSRYLIAALIFQPMYCLVERKQLAFPVHVLRHHVKCMIITQADLE